MGILAAAVLPGINRDAEKINRWVYAAWLGWSGVLLIYYLSFLPAVWQGSGVVFVPVCMFLLGVLGTRKGKAACADVGAVLLIFVLLLFGGISLAAAEDMNWKWAAGDGMESDPSVIAVYLLPGTLCCLRGEGKEQCRKWYLLLPVLGTSLCLLVRGIVPEHGDKIGILELSRSIEVFGRVMRLEAVAAMAVTISLFCLASLLLITLDCCASRITHERKALVLGCALAAILAGMLCKITISDSFAAYGTLICWVILPRGAQLIGYGKKLKNNEKRA